MRQPPNSPVVWVLLGNRVGDNSQTLGLAEALGWPFEQKRFVYTPDEKKRNGRFGAHLDGIERDRSSPIEPPWPDVVMTSSRKNEPIARFIRKHAGKPVTLIRVGRPYSPLWTWDLVITTPQYQLPKRSNVLHSAVCLHRISDDRLALAASQYRDRVAHLPRPLITVLVGGSVRKAALGYEKARQLALEADEFARKRGGSLLVSTSKRTRKEARDGIFSTIKSPSILYEWQPEDPENPFFAFMGLADELIVTADSVSMMTEACATRRPVHLFDTGDGAASMRRPRWFDDDVVSRTGRLMPTAIWKGLVRARSLWSRFGRRKNRRDIRSVQRFLIATKRAVWLGEEISGPPPPPLEDMDRAIERIHRIVEFEV